MAKKQKKYEFTGEITASRSDGYTFTIFIEQSGALKITAGCRFFTPDEARSHWRSTRGGTKLGDESLLIVDHLERMALLQNWQTVQESQND